MSDWKRKRTPGEKEERSIERIKHSTALPSGSYFGQPKFASPSSGSLANSAQAFRMKAPMDACSGVSWIPVSHDAVPNTTGSSEV